MFYHHFINGVNRDAFFSHSPQSFLSKIGSSIANSAGSIVGGILGTAGSVVSSSADRKFQQKMWEQQKAYNEEMWNKQNEYNSPANQKKLYEDAGFNPYLMMSGSSSSVASAPSIAQYQNPQTSYSDMVQNMVGNISQAMQMSIANQDLKNKRLENDYLNATLVDRIANMKASVNGLKLDNKTKELTNRFFNESLNARVTQEEERASLMFQERLNAQAQGSIVELQKDILKYNRDEILPRQASQISTDIYSKLQTVLTNWFNARTSRMSSQSQISLNQATIKSINQQVTNLIQDEETKKFWNRINDATKSSIILNIVAGATNQSLQPIWNSIGAFTSLGGVLK